MKLIGAIIIELIDSEKSLTSPLLKTKVLATKLKNSELLKWVDCELAGYGEGQENPDYRFALGQLLGTYKNGYQLYNNQPLMASVLPKEFGDLVNKSPLRMSIESMEALLKNDEGGTMVINLPAEVCHMIGRKYREMGNPFFEILSANIEMPKGALVQALSSIRSKLLELILELEEEYGDIELDELIADHTKANKIIIGNMMNNIIDGDGNIINTGDKNKISNKVNIQIGDIETVKKTLKESGIEDADIIEIVEILEEEEPDNETKKLGPKTNGWIQKMIGKSLDGSWQIGMGAAGELLANVISAYYGI